MDNQNTDKQTTDNKGKVALITGSTSGIGLALARQLASEGYNIVLNGSRPKVKAKYAVSSIKKKYGVEASYIQADMSKTSEAKGLVDQVGEKYGRIDVAVLNAGFQHVKRIEEFTEEEYFKIIDVNQNAPFFMTQKLVPYLQKSHGYWIGVSSMQKLERSEKKAPYNLTKNAMNTLMTTLAKENKDLFSCYTLNPWMTMTPLVQKQIQAKVQNENKTFEQASFELTKGKGFVPMDNMKQAVSSICHGGYASGCAISFIGESVSELPYIRGMSKEFQPCSRTEVLETMDLIEEIIHHSGYVPRPQKPEKETEFEKMVSGRSDVFVVGDAKNSSDHEVRTVERLFSKGLRLDEKRTLIRNLMEHDFFHEWPKKFIIPTFGKQYVRLDMGPDVYGVMKIDFDIAENPPFHMTEGENRLKPFTDKLKTKHGLPLHLNW